MIAQLLRIRHEVEAEESDLDRAIDIDERLVASSRIYPDLEATALSNLGNDLMVRFQRRGNIDDLDRAIESRGKLVALHEAETRLDDRAMTLGEATVARLVAREGSHDRPATKPTMPAPTRTSASSPR